MQEFNFGGIEVICGPMFSGKTEELLRRLRRAQFAKQKVQIFKPKIDQRYSEKHVQSHDATKLPCVSVSHSSEILQNLSENCSVMGVDEIQFLDEGCIALFQKLATRGMRIIVSGLDQDYRGLPFGHMPQLMCLAESVTKLSAICTVCGHPATRTQLLTQGEVSGGTVLPYTKNENNSPVLVGGKELYEPRCRFHHSKDPELMNLSFASMVYS